MALVKCLECGSDVSDKAAACPRCGAPSGAGAIPSPVASQPTPLAPPRRRGVRPFTVILLIGLLGAAYLFLRSSGKTVTSAVSGPETLVSETVVLKEGHAKDFSFTLPSSRRVEVTMTAAPRGVSVFLMNGTDFTGYTAARQKPGSQFTYRRALSTQNALRFSQADVIPEGTWHIVVERPSESLLFGDDSTATVKIIAY